MSNFIRMAGWIIIVLVGIPTGIAAVVLLLGAFDGGFVGQRLVLLIGVAVLFVLGGSAGALLVGFADLLDNVEVIRHYSVNSEQTGLLRKIANREAETQTRQAVASPTGGGRGSGKRSGQDVIKCPRCERRLLPSSARSGRCPHCDAQLPLIQL